MLCFDDLRFKDSCCLSPEACRSSAALTVTVTMKMVSLLNLINMICYCLSPISDLVYWTSCIMFVISDLLSGLYHVYRTTCQCINPYGCAITILYSYQKVSFVYWHISKVQLLVYNYCLFCNWARVLVCMWDMAIIQYDFRASIFCLLISLPFSFKSRPDEVSSAWL